jgi:pimeloyl-ACP methyl ester carboxylesterase
LPTLKINGVNLYYQVKGNGIPIIFVHPPLLSSINFKYQIEGLSNKFKTIVFDIRGHGNSTFSDEPLTYPLISHDIKQILDHLNIDKALLCGYSTGGSIVLDFLLTYPGRASGGILLGAMSEVNDWSLKNRISLAAMLAKTKALDALAISICFGNSNNRKMFKDLYLDAKKGNIKNIEQYYRYSLIYNCTAQLNRIKHPVLSIYGEKDTGFHHYAHLINEKLPNNELVFIKKGKHQLPTKSAVEVNKLIYQFAKDH